jgi:hypothetical protein
MMDQIIIRAAFAGFVRPEFLSDDLALEGIFPRGQTSDSSGDNLISMLPAKT